MRWAQLLPLLLEAVEGLSPLLVIVIHLGGNDLTQMTMLSLRVQACEDFIKYRFGFPG